ncbi:MAG TPA: hypothetical protein VND19_11430 [Acetobacteraceae bacterium]|nr:hypothetical protein [Acetobacteraceae bacterium]
MLTGAAGQAPALRGLRYAVAETTSGEAGPTFPIRTDRDFRCNPCVNAPSGVDELTPSRLTEAVVRLLRKAAEPRQTAARQREKIARPMGRPEIDRPETDQPALRPPDSAMAGRRLP